MEASVGDGRQVIVLALLAAAGGPAAFMEALYANYRHSNYSPFTHPAQVFAPRLLAAINEDSRLAHGEVGYLDGDPVCQCQDPAGMHPSIKDVTQPSPGKAIVKVSLGWEHDNPRLASFTLLHTGAGWRIADVGSPDEPSLLSALEASNRKIRARH